MKTHRRLLAALGAAGIILGAAAFQLLGGAYDTSSGDALDALLDPLLWGHPGTLAGLILGDDLAQRLGFAPAISLPTATLIVWNIRVPRILSGALVGIDLAISGTLFQAITRNDLASPYTLGVGAGSGLAIWLILVASPSLGVHLPLAASLGGALAFLLTYSIAWSRGASPVRLVLAGVIVSALAGSVQSALFFLARDLNAIQDAAAWTVGSLAGTGWQHVRLALPWTVLLFILSLAASRYLDLLLLGDAAAHSLGLRIERARFLLAALAIGAASTAISVGGHIAFVGLIVPHIVRTLAPGGHRAWLLGALLAGPALLMSADAAARLAIAPAQLPVGVLTGLIGGVYFLYLMRRRRDLGGG